MHETLAERQDRGKVGLWRMVNKLKCLVESKFLSLVNERARAIVQTKEQTSD